MASIIGSGINGNYSKITIYRTSKLFDMASIIGSGINGNVSNTITL